MADILKITTPLINKSQAVPNRPGVDPSVPFNLQDIARVVKTVPDGEILKQNSGMIQKEDGPSILMSLLKDPTVTVGFLKNIFMLQEIIKLLPINNQTMTQEIEQLFDALLIKPEDIVAEMTRQENTSTSFKGELFSILLDLVERSPTPVMKEGVATLLKALNGMQSKPDILDAVSNSLQYLSEALAPSRELSQQLSQLSAQFRQQHAEERFPELKSQVFELFQSVETSILLSPKILKVLSITVYNLSRFQDNPDFLQEAVSNLLTLIDGRDQKAAFHAAMTRYLHEIQQPEYAQKETSKVMDVLAEIIGRQSEDSSITLMNMEKIEKIIHSLLSSPCNFTPLLHFVIPVEHMDIRSFAEIWVNPNEYEQNPDHPEDPPEKCTHLLLAFDIEGIGQFEAELFARGESVDFSLFCPPGYAVAFSKAVDRLSRCIEETGYRFSSILVDKLDRPRSLMEVFKSLPYKRTGINVKV